MDKKQELTKRDELTVRIGQCVINIGKIAEEQSSLQSELESLKEPELKHGDYGIDDDGAIWIVLLRNNQLEVFGSDCGSGQVIKGKTWPDVKKRIGNLVDDLAMLSEPLGRFTVDADIEVSITSCGNLQIRQSNGEDVRINEEAILEFSNNLRRMLAMLKAKENKKHGRERPKPTDNNT